MGGYGGLTPSDPTSRTQPAVSERLERVRSLVAGGRGWAGEMRRRSREGRQSDKPFFGVSPTQALLASLRAATPSAGRHSLASLVAGCDQADLVDLAISEGVAGPASQKLSRLLSPEQGARLLLAASVESFHHLAYLGILEKLADALDQAKVTWVVLKGPVVAELSYMGAPHRYTDLDLMVPPQQLRRAVSALETTGASIAKQDWRLMTKGAKGELTMAVHGSPMVDLHWHLVYLRSARERWKIPADELLERRQRVRLRDLDAWSLDRDDHTAHVALHASFGAVEQLRRLLDIDRTVAHCPPDWEVLVQRCHAWRVNLPVGVLLNRARQVLGTGVPEEVVGELAGGRLNHLLVHQLSDWIPSGPLPGGRSVKNGLTRSLRDRLLTTAGEFTGEAWRTAKKLGQATSRGPDQPGDAVDEFGGVAGLERYLEMVNRANRFGHLSPQEGPEAHS
jgi:Uncharacterised nucleotidyltransferase